MRVKIVIFTILLVVFSSGILECRQNENTEWFSFVLPEKLDIDSPANIGKLVLDPPAGKHGFVTVKNGHFYFEDGTRAKFWGTNLTFNACFPSKKQAELMAERLAFFGFNAVRLHHMDFCFEPRGIFEDVCPAYRSRQAKETGHLSKNQLDKLDYLIYQLKKRGIYIDVNLLVSRHFTEADGLINAKSFDMAAKPVSIFDPKLIKLQKKYAKDLLTHYNPYTKLHYCDDPAIALIEVTNENSIVQSWKRRILDYGNEKSLPVYYLKMLDKKWNQWLKEKYKAIEQIKEEWKMQQKKVTSRENILKNSDELNSWILEKHQNAEFSAVKSGNVFHLQIQKNSALCWHLQFKQINFPLEKDELYEISFKARGNQRTKAALWITQNVSPYKNLGFAKEITLTDKWENFQFFFRANQNFQKSRFTFVLGNTKGGIFLEKIQLRKKSTIGITKEETKNSKFNFTRPSYTQRFLYCKKRNDDIKSFYISLQKSYIDEMINYLKNTLNVKVPITGIGGYTSPEDILTQKTCDYIDTHAYWDHPRFPNKRWDRNDFRIRNKSMLKDKNLGIIGNVLRRNPKAKAYSLKPYTITEWNHCYPNQYAYETPILIASCAVKNDWSALFQYSYSHGWKFNPEFGNIQKYFDSIGNSQQLILCSIGSLVFHKANNIKIDVKDGFYEVDLPNIKGLSGFIKSKTCNLNHITIIPEQDGTIFLCSVENKPIEDSSKLILITVSEIKNRDSGWNDTKTFNWGKDPTLLKKIPVQVIFDTNKKIKVYMLDSEGERSMQVNTEQNGSLVSFSTRKINSIWFEITVESNLKF